MRSHRTSLGSQWIGKADQCSALCLKVAWAQPTARPLHLRVFIPDDHVVVRRGVRDLLDAEPDIVVAGEAADAR